MPQRRTIIITCRKRFAILIKYKQPDEALLQIQACYRLVWQFWKEWQVRYQQGIQIPPNALLFL